jgi:hypothetical protein
VISPSVRHIEHPKSDDAALQHVRNGTVQQGRRTSTVCGPLGYKNTCVVTRQDFQGNEQRAVADLEGDVVLIT